MSAIEAPERLISDLERELAKPAYLDKKGLAHEFSCSVRWIERRMEEGMPHYEIAGRTKFRFDECKEWLDDHGYIKRLGAAA